MPIQIQEMQRRQEVVASLSMWASGLAERIKLREPEWQRSTASYLVSKQGRLMRKALKLSMDPTLYDLMVHSWAFWARPNQLPPEGDWVIWVLSGGRGSGKTKAASEWLHNKAWTEPGLYFFAHRTMSDAKKSVFNPGSGLYATMKPWNPCQIRTDPIRLEFENGSVVHLHSSEVPGAARGPNYKGGVTEELASWKRDVDESGDTLWSNLNLATRIKGADGSEPQIVAPTTPKPTVIMRQLFNFAKEDAKGKMSDHLKEMGRVVWTTASIFENAANLASSWVSSMVRQFKGTRVEGQELRGMMLLEVDGAIVTYEMIERGRDLPNVAAILADLDQTVIGVDPSVKEGRGDEFGISAVGRRGEHAYVLADRTNQFTPNEGCRAVLLLAYELGIENVVAEDNQGGAFIKEGMRLALRELRDEGMVPVGFAVHIELKPSSKGKAPRAQSTLQRYEQGKVHHVHEFPKLEEQITAFTQAAYGGDGSPDSADALIFAMRRLFPESAWGFAEMYEDEPGLDGIEQSEYDEDSPLYASG